MKGSVLKSSYNHDILSEGSNFSGRLAVFRWVSQNYFCNRVLIFPTPTATSPLFYRALVAVLALIFAMKIVPTVGMTNLETML